MGDEGNERGPFCVKFKRKLESLKEGLSEKGYFAVIHIVIHVRFTPVVSTDRYPVAGTALGYCAILVISSNSVRVPAGHQVRKILGINRSADVVSLGDIAAQGALSH